MGLNYLLGPWRLRECDKMALVAWWLVVVAPKDSGSSPTVTDSKAPGDCHSCHAEMEVYLDHLFFSQTQ